MSEESYEFYILVAILAGGILFFKLFSRLVVWDHKRSRRGDLTARAAEAGSAQARYELALELVSAEPSAKDARRAAELFHQASEEGHIEAGVCLGECYMLGLGVEESPARAIELWQHARRRGSVRAVLLLAECYLEGRGVPQDEAHAVELYRRAAEKDDAQAFYMLGRCYLLGLGVKENRRAAIKWLRRAQLYRSEEAAQLLDTLNDHQ